MRSRTLVEHRTLWYLASLHTGGDVEVDVREFLLFVGVSRLCLDCTTKHIRGLTASVNFESYTLFTLTESEPFGWAVNTKDDAAMAASKTITHDERNAEPLLTLE